MTWLNPAAFAFLAFIPVIILLHSLRYRRRDLPVSTLFLWDSVLREAHGTLGLRRLVQNLPLLLQIILVLLLTAVLAQPTLTSAVSDSKDIVLVLDVSASMQTRTPQGTRFAQAQQRALEILRDLPSDRQMAVIAADRQPRVVTFFTQEKALLRQAITSLEVSDAPGNMRDAVLLALSFTQSSRPQEVVVIGDGAYGQMSELDFPRSQIRHIRIAGGERNVGIIHLAFRKPLGAEDRYEVLITVRNFSRQSVDTPLRLTLQHRRLLERQLSLQPGQEEVVVAAFDGPLKGVAMAELLVDDDLELDNRAYGVLAAKTQTWILLVGQSNYFLERLLTSLPGVLVNVIPEVSAEALPRLLEANHLIVFNGVQPPPLREGNYLLINTVPQDERLQEHGVVVQPQVLDWDHSHPLLQFVDFTDVHIEEALALRTRGGAQSLVEGTDTSLLSVIEEPRLRLVTLAFDPMRSDLPLRVAFPVFITNLLHWLAPQQGDFTAGQIRAGMPYAVFFDTPVERVSVQDPQGNTRDYEVQGNPWIFTDANRIGVYIMRAGEQKRYLTVSLLDQTESDISPAGALPSLTPGEEASAVQYAGVIETPLWPYVLLGAVLILVGEWYVWCRDF
jgi:Ca-activated chloride channel family protein